MDTDQSNLDLFSAALPEPYLNTHYDILDNNGYKIYWDTNLVPVYFTISIYNRYGNLLAEQHVQVGSPYTVNLTILMMQIHILLLLTGSCILQ